MDGVKGLGGIWCAEPLQEWCSERSLDLAPLLVEFFFRDVRIAFHEHAHTGELWRVAMLLEFMSNTP